MDGGGCVSAVIGDVIRKQKTVSYPKFYLMPWHLWSSMVYASENSFILSKLLSTNINIIPMSDH